MQKINKDVDITDLEKVENNIIKTEKLFHKEIKMISEIEKGHISKITHFIMSVADRAIAFNRAFLTLTKIDNYQSAICLIRLQLDNCLRLYAYSIANDSNGFYDKVLGGTHIRNMTDRESKKMTDSHLTTELDKIMPGIKELYSNTSGFIHFSHRHLFMNNKVEAINENELKIKTKIGDIDKLEIFKKVDYAFNMFMATKYLLDLISSYRIEIKDSH